MNRLPSPVSSCSIWISSAPEMEKASSSENPASRKLLRVRSAAGRSRNAAMM